MAQIERSQVLRRLGDDRAVVERRAFMYCDCGMAIVLPRGIRLFIEPANSRASVIVWADKNQLQPEGNCPVCQGDLNLVPPHVVDLIRAEVSDE